MLPPLPRVEVRLVRDRTEPGATGGFLNLQRVDLVAHAPPAAPSRAFAYDVATRASLDAVVIAAHYERMETVRVFLRSSLRPALALRPIPPSYEPTLWELPAGLIDGQESPAQAAARELAEELGFDVAPADLAPLGPPAFPAPGFIAEAHHFFRVEVDPEARHAPTEDGSVLEKDAVIADVTLDEALAHCRAGDIRDAKTELALRRLAEILAEGRGPRGPIP